MPTTSARTALAGMGLVFASACGSTVPVDAGSVHPAPPPVSDGPAVDGVLPPSGTAPRTADRTGRQAPAPPTPAAITTTSAAAQPVTAPITLGILGTESVNTASGSVGIESGNSFSIIQAQRALVDAINAQGGLAGRRINAIYRTVNAGSSSYDSDYQAACSAFTQDQRVAAVLSTTSILSPILEQCLSKAGVIHVEASYGSVDAAALRGWPGLLLPGSPSTERRESAKLSVLHRIQWLTPRSRLGVLVEDCPDQVAGYRQGLVPTARALHLTVVATQYLGCIKGFADNGTAASAIQNAQLQFRSQNVDRVVIVSNQEAAIFILFAGVAESQQYRPGYVLSSAAAPVVAPANVPAAQLSNVRFAGWAPTLDVTPGHGPPATAAFARCVRLAATMGLRASTPTDAFYLAYVCDSLFAYERLLQVGNGASGFADVLSAVPRVGRSYLSPVAYGGVTDLTRRRDAIAQVAPGGYESRCSCLRYFSPAQPLG
jgi:hypothetical protein